MSIFYSLILNHKINKSKRAIIKKLNERLEKENKKEEDDRSSFVSEKIDKFFKTFVNFFKY